MRLADRYITMEFLRALLFALLAFLALFTLLEALNLSKLESDKPRRHMYLYLVYAQPQVFQKVLPMALTFAVCFVTAQFSASRELVALYSAGRSFYRVMAPIYSSALLCAVVIFVFSNFITPPATRLANLEQDQLRKGAPKTLVREMVFQKNLRGRKGFYFLYYYDRETKSVLGGFNYLELAPGGRPTYMVEAQEAQMQDDGGWRLLNGRELRFDEEGLIKAVTAFAEQEYRFPDEPDFFTRPPRDRKEMNVIELLSEIRSLRELGFDSSPYEVQLHSSFSLPLVCVAIALLSSIAGATGNHRTGNPLVRSILISAGLIVVYYITISVAESLGDSNVFPPPVVWAPTMLYGAAAIGLALRFRR